MDFPQPSAPPKPRFRRFAAAVLGGVAAGALAAGGWTAAWRGLSAHAVESAETWLENQPGGGARAQALAACPDLEPAGFPFYIGVRCARPAVTFADGARWRGPPVELRAALWRPSRWRATWPGRHRITDANGGESIFTAAALAGAFDASEGAERFEISITGAAGESGLVQGWFLESAHLDLTREGAGAVHFETEISGVVTPEDMAGGAQLGRRIEHFGLAGDITGPLETRRWPPGAAALAEWRDAGGVIEFEKISAVFGALAVEGGGTLALDALLQPQGAFSLRISGYEETLTALARRGVMGPGEAAMAGFVLGALAEKPEGGGPPYVKAPLTIQDNEISVGPLKLGTLPPMRWPE
ncbi:MAG: DUF2125 domain-containing protein [Rhodospirillales bacterium]